VIAFLKEFNPEAEFVAGSAAFSPCETSKKPLASLSSLGPIRNREHFSGIRAFSFRPPPPITWAGWSAWSRLAKAEFGEKLIRVKGLLQIADHGEIALVQAVQGVFHSPQRLREWPSADHGNRLVCIARDLKEKDIAATLPALNAPAGTQASYALKELQERQTQQ
jgi:G3E family GTPase